MAKRSGHSLPGAGAGDDAAATASSSSHLTGASGVQQQSPLSKRFIKDASCSDPYAAGARTIAQEHVSYTPPSGTLCHVFISHAGKQKRGFVDFLLKEFNELHPALKVFVDEHSLDKGADALPAINAALGDAFVVVVVLSEAFISKPYPMEELRLLLEWRRQGSTAKLLPVFYDITWEDVNNKVKEYKQAACSDTELRRSKYSIDLCSMIKGYVAARRERWQGAANAKQKQQWGRDLEELEGITGIRSDQVGSARESHLAKTVVEHAAKLLVEMQQMPFRKLEEVPDIIVGLDAQKEHLVQLLADDSNRRMVLLHGMGGIGKTTLAKTVFNYLHQCHPTLPCCFVTLDEAMDDDGIVKKQQQLVEELVNIKVPIPHSAKKGRMLLAQNLLGRKVLVVVDNVWGSQLEMLLPDGVMEKVLGEGSIVLVTSRDSTAADTCQGQVGVEVVEMECLPDQKALELFCKYAYGSSSPPASNEERVKGVVARCGGLPMAVEVVGRHLGARGTNKQAALNRFNAALPYAYGKVKAGRKERHNTLFAALQLSWDALDEKEKGALLDIVWFLQGREWELVEAYCACDYGALSGLCKLGLVKRCHQAKTFHTVAMEVAVVHDAIVAFCKTHVQHQRGQRVELDGSDTAGGAALDRIAEVDVLLGLDLRSDRMDEATCAELHESKALRFLSWRYAQPYPRQLPSPKPSLCWLEIKGPFPNSGQQAGPFSNSGQQAPNKLTLQLQGLNNLAVLLLDRLNNMEGLELQACTSLQVVRLRSCERLAKVERSGLDALQQLFINACPLQELNCYAQIRSLTCLNLVDCQQLSRLNVDGLPGLQQISIVNCVQLQRLDLLGQLAELTALRVSGCNQLQSMAMKHAVVLPELSISYCHQLQKLGCHVTLAALTALQINDCGGLQSIHMSGLTALQHLSIRRCETLHTLESLGQLASLRALTVNDCGQLRRVHMKSLTSLQHVNVNDCGKLQELVINEQLAALTVSGCQQLQRMELKGCTALQKLSITDCGSSRRDYSPGAALIGWNVHDSAELNMDVEVSSGLKHLRISDMRQLQERDGRFRLEALTTLVIDGCKLLQRVDFDVLTSLQSLHISDCDQLQELNCNSERAVLRLPVVNERGKLQGVGVTGLTALQHLIIGRCRALCEVNCLGQLAALTSLQVKCCNQLRMVDVRPLTALKTVEFYGCNQLQELDCLGQLAALTELVLRGWHLQRVDLKGLTALQRLRISDCVHLPELTLDEQSALHMQPLSVVGSQQLLQMVDVTVLTALKHLDITGCQYVQQLKFGRELALLEPHQEPACRGQVTALRVAECRELQRLDVRGLNALQRLKIYRCKELLELDCGGQLAACTKLWVDSCQQLPRLDVSCLTALQHLSIYRCGQLQELDCHEQLAALTALMVERCQELRQVNLEGCTALRSLSISYCLQLRALGGFAPPGGIQGTSAGSRRGLHSWCLEDLKLQGCYMLAGVLDVSMYPSLTRAQLDDSMTKFNVMGRRN